MQRIDLRTLYPFFLSIKSEISNFPFNKPLVLWDIHRLYILLYTTKGIEESGEELTYLHLHLSSSPLSLGAIA
jgi:hypothetical protein